MPRSSRTESTWIDSGQCLEMKPWLASTGSTAGKSFCFGSCAGTGRYKRVDTIIDAASAVKKREAAGKFRILVLGDAPSGRKLRKLAAERGSRRIRLFFLAVLHTTTSFPLISLFDAAFVLSDSIETISFAAREMMAMGKPLI